MRVGLRSARRVPGTMIEQILSVEQTEDYNPILRLEIRCPKMRWGMGGVEFVRVRRKGAESNRNRGRSDSLGGQGR